MRIAGLTSLAFVGLLSASCGKHAGSSASPTTTAAPALLLTIDGIDITLEDVEPIVAFLRSTHPEVGRKTVVQTVLEKHVVPLRLAERAFAEERERLRRDAEALSEVATNVLELEANEGNLRVFERKKYTRLQPDLAVAMFLFDPMLHGAVKPIAVPRGFVVAAVHEYVETPVAGEDMADATQVGFFTHTVGQWRDWLAAEQARVADKITYVHPDYREALPTWCKKPR